MRIRGTGGPEPPTVMLPLNLIASFYGHDPRTTEFFLGTFGPHGGGWGAKQNEDGVSGTVCLNDGDNNVTNNLGGYIIEISVDQLGPP